MIAWRLLTVLFALLVASCLYFRYFRGFCLRKRYRLVVFLLLLLCCSGLGLGSFAFYDILGPRIFPYWRHVWFFLFALMLSWFCLTAVVELVFAPLRLFRSARRVLSSVAYKCVVFVLALALTGYGQYQGLKMPQIRKITLTSPLVEKPVSIAVASDLHVTRVTGAKRVGRIVKRINRLHADLVVLPGDIFDDRIDLVRPAAAPLASLEAPLGIYFSSGNHEYYSGIYDANGLAQELGMILLDNRGVAVRGDLYLGAVPDLRAGPRFGFKADPKAALAGAGERQFRVLLSHEPFDGGADLVISGHTHGGQMLPFQIFAKFANHGFPAGLYDLEVGRHIYVTRGAGTWGPAIRQLAPSDVTLITILPEGR